jgi:hypothetical protein
MEIGKLLKEKHGFNDPDVVLAFHKKYGYSIKFINSVLNDEFPVLTYMHLRDISHFTGIPFRELTKLESPMPSSGIGYPAIPLGKLFFCSMPVMGKIEIDDLEVFLKEKSDK